MLMRWEIWATYCTNKKKYDQAKKYLTITINHNNKMAINLLFLILMEKKYDMIKKTFIPFAEKDNVMAMELLCTFYCEQKNYDEIEKYFLLGIEKQNEHIMFGILSFYDDMNKNDILMKILQNALDKGYCGAMLLMGCLCKKTKPV